MHVKITNGTVDTYPYNVGQLRRDNPQTSFPKQIPDEMLAEYGIYPVTIETAPSIDDRTQKNEQATTPTLMDGSWVLTWSTTSKTAEEIAEYDANMAVQNRSERNAKLAATDYLALSDNTMSAEMTTYRQALRDITAHSNWPNLEEADWPTKP